VPKSVHQFPVKKDGSGYYWFLIDLRIKCVTSGRSKRVGRWGGGDCLSHLSSEGANGGDHPCANNESSEPQRLRALPAMN